jgi:hypothetical protein
MAGRGVKRALAALAACAALGASAADEGWYLQVDNDVFYGTDRWYTSGARIARVKSRGDHQVEIGVLQEIYTPEAKRHNDIDRPNAARLLATVARHDRVPGDWRTLELDLGVTGPSALGRQAQEFVHRYVSAPHEDWSHQRPDRFDGQASWVRTRTLGQESSGSPHLDATYGAVLGNQVAFAHAGLELRFGTGGAARDMSSPALRFAATPPLSFAQDGSWSFFLALSTRAVAWNHLLDFAPDLPQSTPRLRHAVQRFLGGFAWSHRLAQVTFVLVHDTREFVGQRRDHGFGSLTVHVPF